MQSHKILQSRRAGDFCFITKMCVGVYFKTVVNACVQPEEIGRAQFNLATLTYATLACTAYVLPYNL